MSERRYDDREIAAIFRLATEGPEAPPHHAAGEAGLTLADLQAIGREVGISPDAVAHAAVALDVRRGATQRTLLGLPIGVSRTVELNRRMTDEEWERFVVQLREVFNARGATRSDGSLRQWTNGNLHVLLEPTSAGHRIRFGTMHGGAMASIGSGIAALGVTGAMGIAAAAAHGLSAAVPGLLFSGLIGLGLIANGAFRLPRWARLRGRQMEALATEVAHPPDPPGQPAPARLTE